MADTFSAEERAAMKDRAKELKAQAKQADFTQDVLDRINEMPDDERAIAEKIHELVTKHAPNLSPKTWYGMPGWALDGAIVIFFQAATKFKARYSTLGFNDTAKLDDGSFWPTAYALTKITKVDEKAIIDLITKAAG
ncbi:hypothetical protein EYE40_03770 [Glaciihabitans arcticus]|uniref:Uncharacterized protein n=1 Tax=Glaciihabitans arcticus TaxID=2668039 RepID=A0A4Q9GPB1_9MICO|nr:DUF1801 domain-containing protein [Glaciihabitans arcticus]TBN56586.1 hypothetical protein EYE40_03770 [Glaciihabitans arcticus]